MRLRALAPAKINLSLILGPVRESDGRHELVTVFDALSLCDELVLETETATVTHDEVVCAGVTGENLAARAIAGLRARGWGGPPVRITITKRIPVAAGMAGGSADAAAALRLAMALAPGRPEELEAVAAELGADVPAQLEPGIALGTGAGERIERFGPLAEHAVVVVPAREALATPAVFREADRLGLPRPLAELEARHAELLTRLAAGELPPPALLVNDLQPAALSLCPPVAAALDALAASGADHAMVSGSGPTTAGLWWGEGAWTRAQEAAAALGGRWPGTVACRPVDGATARPVLLD